MTKAMVLTTTWTNYSKSFSLTLDFKSGRTNPVIGHLVHIVHYYMALSHEDWELQNSRIWLAKIDIDRGLDFPI